MDLSAITANINAFANKILEKLNGKADVGHTHTDLQTAIDGKATDYGSNNASGITNSDWYTIFSNLSNQFSVSFYLHWTVGGYHGYAYVQVSGAFGYPPMITATCVSRYGPYALPKIRARYNSTYDGYLVQVQGGTGSPSTAMYYTVLHQNGTTLRDFVLDADSTSFVNGTMTKTVQLDLQPERALQTSHNISVSNGQYVWHGGNFDPSLKSDVGHTHDNVDNIVKSVADSTTINTDYGYLRLGAQNSSYCHIYTDSPEFYFNQQIKVLGSTVWHGGNFDPSLKSDVGHTHNLLSEDSLIGFGRSGLQWTDTASGNTGTGVDGEAPENPFSDWHHHLIMNHGNSGGYYAQLAFSFHSDRVFFRRMTNGVKADFLELWHGGNFDPSLKSDVGHTHDDKLTRLNSATQLNLSANALDVMPNINVVGGWARAMRVKNVSGSSEFGAFGVLGSGDNVTYAYIGVSPSASTTGYDQPNLLKVYPDRVTFDDGELWHEGNLSNPLNADANSDVLLNGRQWWGESLRRLYFSDVVSEQAWIGGGAGGNMLELGSDDTVKFYETDANALCVDWSLSNQTYNFIGEIKQNNSKVYDESEFNIPFGTNRLRIQDWQVGQTPPWSVNGSASEQNITFGTLHNGQQGKIWQCIPDGGNNGDGGWQHDVTGFDTLKTDQDWIYGVYYKKKSNVGGFYFGCMSGVLNLSGSSNGNPYFVNFNQGSSSNIQQDKWYLVVGVIRAYGSTGETNVNSGVYDCETGELVSSGTTFRFASTSQAQRHRCYHYYNTSGDGATVHQEMAQPFLIPANECPSIAELCGVKGTPSKFVNGNDSYMPSKALTLDTDKSLYVAQNASTWRNAVRFDSSESKMVFGDDGAAIRIDGSSLEFNITAALDLPNGTKFGSLTLNSGGSGINSYTSYNLLSEDGSGVYFNKDIGYKPTYIGGGVVRIKPSNVYINNDGASSSAVLVFANTGASNAISVDSNGIDLIAPAVKVNGTALPATPAWIYPSVDTGDWLVHKAVAYRVWGDGKVELKGAVHQNSSAALTALFTANAIAPSGNHHHFPLNSYGIGPANDKPILTIAATTGAVSVRYEDGQAHTDTILLDGIYYFI